MLTASNITMQFGAKPLFENVNVKFGDGNRYGLIGANGCGKSTFMKILCGLLEPTAGNVAKDPHERMAYLRQDQFAYEDMRVLDVVLMGHAELWTCMREKDAIYMNPEATEADYMHAAELEAKFGEMGGYDAEARAGELLLGIDIPSDLHQGPMREVAPGWKLRVLLAQALFADPDILLLDEPTNNLDINTIRWLEDVLNQRASTMVIISHDRHFLNQVCTHMADLDFQTLRVYPGNYDDYMEASTLARERQQAANARAKEKIANLQNFVRRFSANASKAKQATSRLKLIDKLKPEDVKPSSRQYPWIRFEYDEREKLHRQACEIENLRFGYDPATPIIQGFTASIDAGDKIAIIGENGVGKTTLVKLLVGELKPLSGHIKWAEKARLGYYAQDHGNDFAGDENLTDWIGGYVREGGYEGDDAETLLRGTLGRLLFKGDEVKKSVKVISGGEQGRMLFGKLMLQRKNVLLMDEPTNHLDMESIESLNTALDQFTGTLVFVSHDREFVASLANRVIEIKQDGRIIDYRGRYDEYLASQGIE
ncbi:MAG: ABC-F family ATPase [Hydrogenophilales bacterium CG03_land_8_20_14_0_80_62_28]|nr:ABC-F family ATPase [Betaproteobacteria bacterium]OIO78613.1 MAG: ABC-F family ATPase [Hydrogenophilaceae bacterium CG1_02_62_390]PIV22707.1 MAG: ABC-F family ATPase [Hydrogenophilales bacterium CG03_land_8_20_14_0_80_62_28]PIW39085.1 MAG: ABC-F family ATPase [Hydrogenophilales bacterium CG15_BIG_FIL_POST_REV_8_21_14_020_62_31]PIW72785.1 MAG: ABC-F family ATPase [Hydrogenophilales bacterium CG12_big_fil_rev_8_21_14_0_65_61_21]PIX01378.1 MAG: ABC-F family ATPase [Hydrogenophilales bacterium 